MYDWMLMLSQEVEYFWTGIWTISRVLYLANRYLPLCAMSLLIFAFSARDPRTDVCLDAGRSAAVLETLGVLTGQAVIIFRIWYLYSRCKAVQIFVCIVYVASFAAIIGELWLSLRGYKVQSATPIPGAFPVLGCMFIPNHNSWRIFVPTLVLHTVLYMLTAFRAFYSRGGLKRTPLVQRLLRDNGLFYLVMLFSAGFTVAGARRADIPSLYGAAVFSMLMMAVTSVCMSRMILGLRSLAADLSLDPEWVLNRAELSRVPWRYGAEDGELYVDVDAGDDINAVPPQRI
ncbi:hypothetical protein PLICRDRAFT_37590 [Plicaturopsis crispa FD-325 SS-3]|nr:hypothetical protein PLICRDRAFT_37590 [Plicaturopsis crispa FD-325 SS-3]